MACHDGVNTLTYDAEGRLATSYSPTFAVTSSYFYDAGGQRVSKIFGSYETDYVHDPGGALLATYVNGSYFGNFQDMWVNGMHFGEVVMAAGNASQTQNFSLTDWLGSQAAYTDPATGVPNAAYVSQPFGDAQTTLFGSNNDDIHFTGKERDGETGNDYFGARYYASSMGRFLSPDSSGYSGLKNPQSWNLYAYTLNNPLRYIDPTGNTVQNVCTDQAACTAAVAAATGNAEAASRVGSTTTVTHHSFLGIKWDTSVTNITISGDMASFRALSTNASHLADLVESKQNFTVDIRDQGYFTNDRQGSLGTGPLSSQFQYAGGYTQTPSMTGNNDGNVYIKWNPGPDDVANEAGIEHIPGANRGEAMAHELLGHEWGEVFGGHPIGTAANKQDAVNAENAVRATDPTRGQKAQHDHYQ